MDSIILVRHGQSTLNVQRVISCDHEGYPLTHVGGGEVEYLSSQLTGIRLSGILSSPVLRARQTSEIISRALQRDYEVDDRIRESGLGKYNNFKITGMPPLSHEELGMESWESHIERFLSLIDSRSGRHILVSHAYPIRAILSHYLGLGEHESLGIEVRNATASVIDVENRIVLSIGSSIISGRVLEFLRS
ncbi:MAG TPA: histidine phosphatase family protein [Thermoplasmataceae archaeon]|nr:histidine phosphatase family protein [Thermoplasmataceae archaeon]